MKIPSISNSLLFLFLAILSCSCSAHASAHDHFFRCLSLRSQNSSTIFNVVYTPNNSSYSSVLESTIKNLRFTTPSTPRPQVVVTPIDESQIQAIVVCSRENGLQIRTRSGGHDYEGLSSTSQVPFVVLDLMNMTNIDIDVRQKTAWVQGGASLGQVYYKILQQSRTLAFPAGVCPTVGVGGHISGGGYGVLLRKYGLASDNIIDARLVDVNGRLLDRKTMGEDLFWAIRGGGGGSFGVVTAWKLHLVDVPEIVTAFSVNRTLQQNATELFYKWQTVAPSLPKDAVISTSISSVNSSNAGEKIILVTFTAMYLGRVDGLLALLGERFPELGIRREDCSEGSWAQASLRFAQFPPGVPLEVLISGTQLLTLNLKGKSDYVEQAIPKDGIEGIYNYFYENEANSAQMLMMPYGGRMAEIQESAIPFPHRAGKLYQVQYVVLWDAPGQDASTRHINWIRRLYSYMTPHVSKYPREAYINYRDLDVGANNEGNTSYAQASIWGYKYFKKNNFNRLVRVKISVDPSNYFRHEQSIPPLYKF